MENESEKWHKQTWVIPLSLSITRIGESWYLEDTTGTFRTPVEAKVGELLVLVTNEIRRIEREERQ